MDLAMEAVAVALVLTDMALLGMSRLGTCIRVVAFQGALLGALAVLANAGDLGVRLVLIASASVSIKALVVPALLIRAIREAGVRREIDPFVGFAWSVLAGMAMVGVSMWIASRLALGPREVGPLVVPAAFTTMLTGLFLVITRRKALTQVLGYLVFENGIYAFGVATVGEVPALVELGVLLDVFVAVFVMGIAIFHINREFDHIDADELRTLRG